MSGVAAADVSAARNGNPKQEGIGRPSIEQSSWPVPSRSGRQVSRGVALIGLDRCEILFGDLERFLGELRGRL